MTRSAQRKAKGWKASCRSELSRELNKIDLQYSDEEKALRANAYADAMSRYVLAVVEPSLLERNRGARPHPGAEKTVQEMLSELDQLEQDFRLLVLGWGLLPDLFPTFAAPLSKARTRLLNALSEKSQDEYFGTMVRSERPPKLVRVPGAWPLDITSENDLARDPATLAQKGHDRLFYEAATWTGSRTYSQHARAVKTLAPVALAEIETLIDLIEKRRFNDAATAEALQHLRNLHAALGDLISAAEARRPLAALLKSLDVHKQGLANSLKQGAKLCVAAPAMTLGIVHLLSAVSGVPVDSQLVATVYAALVGADVLPKIGRHSARVRGKA